VWGATFGGFANDDYFGHGTFVAFVAMGARFGVAKAANAIAVKVLDNSGGGTVRDTIAGVEWVIKNATATGKSSILNISAGGPPNDAIDEAVEAAVQAGIHVAAGAGNSNVDVSGITPARGKLIC
jgi:cerevisin